MSKTKSKSHPHSSLLERVCLFVTIAGMFVFNGFCVMLPVYVFTDISRTQALAHHMLVLSALLFTYISVQVYYRLIRWLEGRNILLAVAYMVMFAVMFAVACVGGIMITTVLLATQTVFGVLTDESWALLSTMMFLLMPQLLLTVIYGVLLIYDRFRPRIMPVLMSN